MLYNFGSVLWLTTIIVSSFAAGVLIGLSVGWKYGRFYGESWGYQAGYFAALATADGTDELRKASPKARDYRIKPE